MNPRPGERLSSACRRSSASDVLSSSFLRGVAMDEILKGRKVMVVDDTAVARMLVADVLTSGGIEMLEADTGEQALKLAGEHAIAAFRLDIRLPDMNGIELCRALPA